MWYLLEDVGGGIGILIDTEVGKTDQSNLAWNRFVSEITYLHDLYLLGRSLIASALLYMAEVKAIFL